MAITTRSAGAAGAADGKANTNAKANAAGQLRRFAPVQAPRTPALLRGRRRRQGRVP